ncbi:leucine-rich repeat domain-containing protein [Paracidovorax konjaci]|uniref:Leucine rich repeat-containing protein n=1 Tax=Paracidovorax konjaci TaxID=32040 RepID=A0A1I1W8V3_9BURK|nr:leucine-rich repeat domain-containing protein [Paracidovorax konjaci]SFD89843.1 hypothetical protein SAMN04489710_108100 [Paracidovorax konjaci]
MPSSALATPRPSAPAQALAVPAAAGARGLRLRSVPADLGQRRWERQLRDWCEADPERGAPEGRGGLLSRMARRFQPGAAAHGFSERREEAVQRVLQAHAGRAATLDLGLLALSELPPGLERLPHLQALDLSNNTGLYHLPDVLAQCRGLRALRACNSFVTEVPAGLFLLPHLETLDLSANFGLCRLPATLGQATRLRVLRLSHCRFEAVPQALAHLPALQHADFSHNPRLRGLPAGWPAGDTRLGLQGTPAALQAELLRPAAWTDAERSALRAGLHGIGAAPGARASDAARRALFLAERVDGTATGASWDDAARTVDAWVAEGRPLTADGLLELGWIANGRPPGESRLRAHEFQRVPAGAGPAMDSCRSYPPVESLPGHLADIADRLGAGPIDPIGPTDPLAAVERAALLYQAFMSLRPLSAGNAPAALLAMDWALLQRGLPPARLPPGETALCDAKVFAGQPGCGAKALVQQIARGLAAGAVRRRF